MGGSQSRPTCTSLVSNIRRHIKPVISILVETGILLDHLAQTMRQGGRLANNLAQGIERVKHSNRLHAHIKTH